MGTVRYAENIQLSLVGRTATFFHLTSDRLLYYPFLPVDLQRSANVGNQGRIVLSRGVPWNEGVIRWCGLFTERGIKRIIG